MKDILITLALVIFVIVTSYSDLRYKKIYNWLTVPFMLLGLIANICISGVSGIYTAITGIMVGFILLFIPFVKGWLGGGDVKLLAAAGGWIGPLLVLYATLLGFIFSGIAAFIHLLIKGNLKKFLIGLKLILFNWNLLKEEEAIEVTGKIPLGVFLGLGILATWVYFKFYV